MRKTHPTIRPAMTIYDVLYYSEQKSDYVPPHPNPLPQWGRGEKDGTYLMLWLITLRFDLQLVSDDIEPGWRGGPLERPVASAGNPVKGCVRRTLHWNLLRQGNESYWARRDPESPPGVLDRRAFFVYINKYFSMTRYASHHHLEKSMIFLSLSWQPVFAAWDFFRKPIDKECGDL